MRITRIKSTALVCTLILSVGRLGIAEGTHAASPAGLRAAMPVIKEFSSKGGKTQNKTGLKDRMYLAAPGDKITFSVKADGADKYEWRVNKKVIKEAKGETMTWTVPDAKGIWEIHLKITGGGGEARQEWVVSTLLRKDAPDIFDYFADCKSFGRKAKDPWGRPLPEWTGKEKYAPHVTKGMADSKEGVTWATIPSTIAYGTWKFRYRFPEAMKKCNPESIGLKFIKVSGKGGGSYGFNQCCDSHHHCWINHAGADFSIDYDDGVYLLDKWYEVTIVRTRDGRLYMYRDNRIEFLAHDEAIKKCESLFLDIRGVKNPQRFFDCLEVYKNKYLFPPKSIRFEDYVWNYHYQKGKSWPVRKKGIVVKGRGVTLADIAKEIGDPKLFTYDAAAKTAVCRTNLVVDEAAELIIKDQTLKFDCKTDGALEFAPKYASRVHIENSRLTSTDEHYWVWNNAGSTTHYGYETKLGEGRHPDYYDFVMILAGAHHGSLIVKNSTIDNTAHILFDSPYELDITGAKFTNIREVDIGNYGTFKGSYSEAVRDMRLFLKGDKGFWIHTDDMNVDAFHLNNIQFSGKAGPLNLTFMINAHRDKLNLYNIDAKNENIVIKEALAQTHRQSHTIYADSAPYDWKSYIDSGLGLVNCRFRELKVTTGLFRDCEGNPRKKFGAVKYYLDVKVVDPAGKPVPGAKVSVVNEIDDENFPAENCKTIKPYAGDCDALDGGEYCGIYHHRRVVQGLANASTMTGKDGHTPLPDDSDKTIVLTDYVKKIEDSPAGIRIRWRSHPEDVKYITMDVFDKVHGNVFHKVKYTNIKSGNKYHCKVTYKPDARMIRLVVTDKEGKAVWDTGPTRIKADISPLIFDRIGYEVIHKLRYRRNKISYDSKGYIRMNTRHYRGEITADVDNMKLKVAGKVIENNDYSKDPQLKELVKEGFAYYNLKRPTDGKAFTWEYDISFDKFKTDGPWVAIWLRKGKTASTEQVRTINYTYCITIEAGGKKKVITGVNPGAHWYRPDPNKPAYTITAVLDGKTVTEAEMKKALPDR